MKTILVANYKGGCGKTTVAISLAGAFAQSFAHVALADADLQKSSLQWLKRRPDTVAAINHVDWRSDKNIGNTPKHCEYLIIDSPGSVDSEHAQQLIAQCHALIVPVQPSFFDLDSAKRFIKTIDDIKRIRKGKVPIYVVANRVRPHMKERADVVAFFKALNHIPIVWLGERTAYAQLAEQGLSIFDFTQKRYRDIQADWQPLLTVLRES